MIISEIVGKKVIWQAITTYTCAYLSEAYLSEAYLLITDSCIIEPTATYNSDYILFAIQTSLALLPVH